MQFFQGFKKIDLLKFHFKKTISIDLGALKAEEEIN